jgi:hypothetical protein
LILKRIEGVRKVRRQSDEKSNELDDGGFARPAGRASRGWGNQAKTQHCFYSR